MKPEINWDRTRPPPKPIARPRRPPKVEMIAANLISNAVKFTPKGGRITIRASSSDGRVSFEVEDTGPGIPEDQLEQIFERFHQVDSSLSREHEGTGLGLSLARELARLSEGDITARSQVGRGAVFRVELPLEPTTRRLERRQGNNSGGA